jgi:phenylacetate-CoA ligase
LDEHGNRCPPGVRGEITLTGGRNPFLPLLRYRTGDHAAMEFIAGHRVLIGFEGRQPVEYRASDGRMIHSMQLTQLMRRFPVHRYQMREAGNNAYELHIRGDVDRDTFQREISQLFGTAVQIRYDEFETPS